MKTLKIFLVVLVLALIAAITPWFIKSTNAPASNPCVNNLRQIDGAKEQAALVRQWPAGTDCDNLTNKLVVNEYMKNNTTPICPDGGIYQYNPVGKDPECSKARDKNIKTRHKMPE